MPMQYKCKYLQSESKKSVICLVQNYTFFVQLSYMVIFQYFLEILFFGTHMSQKNPAKLLFSQTKV